MFNFMKNDPYKFRRMLEQVQRVFHVGGDTVLKQYGFEKIADLEQKAAEEARENATVAQAAAEKAEAEATAAMQRAEQAARRAREAEQRRRSSMDELRAVEIHVDTLKERIKEDEANEKSYLSALAELLAATREELVDYPKIQECRNQIAVIRIDREAIPSAISLLQARQTELQQILAEFK